MKAGRKDGLKSKKKFKPFEIPQRKWTKAPNGDYFWREGNAIYKTVNPIRFVVNIKTGTCEIDPSD